MNVSIPIYYAAVKPTGAGTGYVAGPLFFPELRLQGDQLHRLNARLARALVERLSEKAKQPRQHDLGDWTFCPEVAQHRHEVAIQLRRRVAKARFLFVVFKHRGRRFAFTPAVPDLWFPLGRHQSLLDRATEALSEHFRGRERDEPELQPEALGLTGTAWVSNLDVTARPPRLIKPKQEPRFLMLGGDAASDGQDELRRVGRCLDWLYPDELDRTLLREPEVDELQRLLAMPDRRPVLITGPAQVGKTALIHEAVYRRVQPRPSPFRDRENVWLISPQRLISGMSYVGQWENRLLAILREAARRGHTLYFDDLLGLFLAGVSASSSLNVAAVLKPVLERREVRVLGEATPEALRVLRERDRGFADLFHLLPVREPGEEENVRILLGVQRQLEGRHGCNISPEVLPTVLDLQRRYARHLAFPGKAARMMRQLAIKVQREQAAGTPALPENRPALNSEQVLEDFRATAGLSTDFLHADRQLSRKSILEALAAQVVGQPQALEAAADVIAVAKARLNDPERPLAAFLMLGPTGVGKTETAKAIAGYLFGSPERLLRFDLNEYLEPGAATRLVGTFEQPDGLLTAAIRRQPFAVVLFDEIEKADPEVFDVLLQVLGEGRLTDARGRTADFTNAILLMTSNLGVREAESRLGFGAERDASAEVYLSAARRFFRPEFFNRIDRVIPFARLGRAEVERIAERAIDGMLQRDGLQRRRMILRVDAAARKRVVDLGFDPVLGARALKRSVEQLLTRPIAAQLARLPHDDFVLIELRGGAHASGGLEVKVTPLQDVPRCEEFHPPSDPQEYLDLLWAAFRRLDAALSRHRPAGAVTLGQVRPEEYRYFVLRERFRDWQASCEQLRGRARGERDLPPPALNPRLAPIPDTRSLTHRAIPDGPSLRQLASTMSLHEAMQELFARGAEGVSDQAVLHLHQQLALLRVMTEADPARDGEMLLVLLGPPPAPGREGRNFALVLARAYLAVLRAPLGVEATWLRDDSQPPVDRPDEAVLHLRGLAARALAEREQGTHLFHRPHQTLQAVQVFAVPCQGGDPGEALARLRAAQEAWEAGPRTDPAPLAFGPLVRTYSGHTMLYDHRTGLVVEELGGDDTGVCLTSPPLLAALPLALEADPPDGEADAARADRRQRAAQYEDWE